MKGRRRELILSSLMYLVGAIITALAPNFAVLVIGRTISGIGIGLVTQFMLFSLLPMFYFCLYFKTWFMCYENEYERTQRYFDKDDKILRRKKLYVHCFLIYRNYWYFCHLFFESRTVELTIDLYEILINFLRRSSCLCSEHLISVFCLLGDACSTNVHCWNFP